MPFEVTHEIDSDYCVGLLDFETPDEYARYAASVIEYETASASSNAREVVFFGTRHPFDDATLLSADWLVAPLADGMPASGRRRRAAGRARSSVSGSASSLRAGATRDALLRRARRRRRDAIACSSLPATAWSGRTAIARQSSAQGALLCQDWPGFGSVAPAHYVSGADVPDGARVHGMITFHFACFGGGTPRRRPLSFRAGAGAAGDRAASRSSPRCRAGCWHIRAAARWPASRTSSARGALDHRHRPRVPQIRPFQRAIGQMLVGKPVGIAVQEFNDLSATLSVVLTGLLGKAFHGHTGRRTGACDHVDASQRRRPALSCSAIRPSPCG